MAAAAVNRVSLKQTNGRETGGGCRLSDVHDI